MMGSDDSVSLALVGFTKTTEATNNRSNSLVAHLACWLAHSGDKEVGTDERRDWCFSPTKNVCKATLVDCVSEGEGEREGGRE